MLLAGLPLALAAATGVVLARGTLIDLLPAVPTQVWGRDEARAGEMWNSNSVVALLDGCSRENARTKSMKSG